MTQRRYPDKSSLSVSGPHAGSGSGANQSGSPVLGNLAVKVSLMEIFDEFTDVISGELRSMNLCDEDLSPPDRPSHGQPKS